MKTAGFWRKNGFLGLAAVAVLFLFAASILIQSRERKADKTSSDLIAVILRFNPKLPPALGTFLDRAMAKQTEARFAAGDEFAPALRASGAIRKRRVDLTI